MGFFSRIGNIWRGFLGLFIKGLEVKHPEAVYEAAIEAKVKQYKRLTSAVAGIVHLRNKLERELTEKTAELKEIQVQVPVAVEQGEDEAALVLIQRKDTLTLEVETIRADLEKTSQEAEEAKSSLLTFQSEIEKLKAEKETMLAKRENAKARMQIQEQLSGLSMDADIRALDNVRESIHKLDAEADVTKELEDGGLAHKLTEIRKKTASASAQAQLAEIKKQMAADKQPPQAQKTM